MDLLPDPLLVVPPPRGFELTIRPPGSKSLSNRALLLAAIADGVSTLRGCLHAEDTNLMRACLDQLGVDVGDYGDDLIVSGAGGPLGGPDGPQLFVGTAGTVARLLTPAIAAGTGHAHVDGTPRMRERPMAELVDALRELGAVIHDRGRPGFLPIEIGPAEARLPGGEVRLARPASSQFVSGLVFAAALAQGPTRIVLEQGTPARPYVDMTLATLRDFGGDAVWEGDTIVVTPQPLRGRTYDIEPDASSASYLLALAAIHGGHTRIEGLGHDSLQGDAAFAHVLARMGAAVQQDATSTEVRGTGELRGIDIDLSDMPDMTLTLAAVAVWATGPTRIRGVDILRHHESDRLAAAATELRRIGATVVEHADGLAIEPPATRIDDACVDTYRDHRMAMAMSLTGRVAIRDPGCVGKTFPRYFSALAKLGMVILG
jgi:3-phosphoshikimate 1-carboxyvinyltransferase